MNSIITTISLDMQSPGAVKRIHGKQNDALSRKVKIMFYDGGTAWNPPTTGYTMQIVYRKPDGTSGLYDLVTSSETERVTAVVSGNSVTAELHPQMFAFAGLVSCALRFISADLTEVLGTFTWFLIVDPSELSGIPSHDYFKFLSLDAVRDMIGDLDDLQTTDKSSAVAAINELAGRTGAVASVNGEEPDENGNVLVTAADVPYQKTIAGEQTHDVAEALDVLAQVTPTNAVKYSAQSLSAAQKAQARENIGAFSTSGGTLSGSLNMDGHTVNLDDGASIYADDEIIMLRANTGSPIEIHDGEIKGIQTVSENDSAASKGYVDTEISSAIGDIETALADI